MLLVRSTPDSFSPTSAGRPLAFRFIGFGCDVRCCLGGCSPSLFDLFIMSLRVCSDATTSFGAVVAEGTHDTKPAGLLTGQVSRVPLSQHLLPRHSTLIFVKLDRPTGYFARQGARTEWLQGDHCLCVKPSMLVLAPPMASCRCPRRVLLGLCDHKPREFLAQHQQLQRYPRDLWSYKFKFTHPPLPSMIRWTII
jgi:hypothetical protein